MVVRFSAAIAALASSVLALGCDDNDDEIVVVGETPALVTFQVTTLVTNATDAALINPWGIVASEGLFWIADNGTGNISVLDASGRPAAEYPPGRFVLGEGITGIAHVQEAGDETSFVIRTGGRCCPPPAATGSRSGTQACRSEAETTTCPTSQAEFVVASMNGTLIAINDEAPTAGIVVVDRSADGAAYFGVTRVDTVNGPLLLAANFAQGRIDVFDPQFRLITPAQGTTAPFSDPELPAGFSPWNVMAFGDLVMVAYAELSGQEEEGVPEEAHGPGLGHVTVFDTNGAVIARLDNTLLNAPWGMAVAQAQAGVDCDHDGDNDADDTCIAQVDCDNDGDFDADDTCTAQVDCDNDGDFDADDTCVTPRVGTIFIGNFGDGHITTFTSDTFQPVAQLNASDGNPLVIDGLWGITFNDNPAVNPGSLFFVAGPNEETGGVFGRLDLVMTRSPEVNVADVDDRN